MCNFLACEFACNNVFVFHSKFVKINARMFKTKKKKNIQYVLLNIIME